MIPSSRKEGKIRGCKFFFTGRPCKRGHICNRYTSTQMCVDCHYIVLQAYRIKTNFFYSKKWNRQHPEFHATWYENNHAATMQQNREYRTKHGKAKVLALIAKRRADISNSTPTWANLEKITEFYKQAAEISLTTGTKHEVDHYYPLRGNLVCGLHVETNLQIITHKENNLKGTKMPELFYKNVDK